MNKLFMLSAIAFAGACTTDTQKPAPTNIDYTGLFDDIKLQVGAKDLTDKGVLENVTLSGGATIAVELELTNSALPAQGSYTLRLAPQSLTALDAFRQVQHVAETDVDRILNDPDAQPVCGVFPLTATAMLDDGAGHIQTVAVSLASTAAVAYAEAGAVKGCRSIIDPGLPGASCGGDCEISLWIVTYSGKCDHTNITVPYYIDGEWVWVPMWYCFCNTSAS